MAREKEKKHLDFVKLSYPEKGLIKCLICSCTMSDKVIKRHLASCHNISKEDYYLLVTNQTKPKCMNPKCGNEVKFLRLHEGYRKYCCDRCYKQSDFNRNRMSKMVKDQWSEENYANKLASQSKYLRAYWSIPENNLKVRKLRSETSKAMHDFKAKNNGYTKTELAFKNQILDKLDLEFQHNKIIYIEGKRLTMVDFYLPKLNLIIEIDDKSHRKTEIKEKDKRNNNKLLSNGYNLLRLPSSDSYNFDDIVDKIYGNV